MIEKYSFEGKIKDGLISKLTINKTGHKPSQFKKISDALPVLCTDKNYQRLNEALRTGRDQVKTEFMPAYPDTTRWSTTHYVQNSTVNPEAPNGSGLGNRPNDRGNNLIAKYSFEGKIKDSPISKQTITKTGHRPSQFKKISDALLVLCIDKTSEASMRPSVPALTKSKLTSCRLIQTPPGSLPPITCKLVL